MTDLTPISTNKAPAALGHYSQAMVHNGLLYVSGQLPINPNDVDETPGDAYAQTTQTLSNIEAILKSTGTALNKVIKADIFINDLAIWPEVNRAYADFFKNHRPARVAVPVNGLPKGYMIEISVIASIN